jgi:hypothetical protein
MNTPRPSSRLSAAFVATCLVAPCLMTAASTSSRADTRTTSRVDSHQTASGRRSQGHPDVLRFGVDFSPPNVIDVPPLQARPGDYKAGDYVTFGDVLVDRAGHHMGTEAGTGMITRVDRSGVQVFYSMAIELRGGQIAGSGIGSPDPHKHLAVTGGTGAFTGASGSVSVVENGDGTGALTIRIH